jgi:integrase
MDHLRHTARIVGIRFIPAYALYVRNRIAHRHTVISVFQHIQIIASIANSQHVPLYSICKALGHSSTTITSQIYTHLFDETHQDVVDLVGKAITQAS